MLHDRVPPGCGQDAVQPEDNLLNAGDKGAEEWKAVDNLLLPLEVKLNGTDYPNRILPSAEMKHERE